MLDQTWLRSKYCFHPPETMLDMLWKDDYRQYSRKQRKLTNGVLVLTEVPEPIMMLMRQRSKQCGSQSTSHLQR